MPTDSSAPAAPPTWHAIIESSRLGYLTDEDDLEAIVRAHGDWTLVVRATTDARHVVPASLFCLLRSAPECAYVHAVFAVGPDVTKRAPRMAVGTLAIADSGHPQLALAIRRFTRAR